MELSTDERRGDCSKVANSRKDRLKDKERNFHSQPFSAAPRLSASTRPLSIHHYRGEGGGARFRTWNIIKSDSRNVFF